MSLLDANSDSLPPSVSTPLASSLSRAGSLYHKRGAHIVELFVRDPSQSSVEVQSASESDSSIDPPEPSKETEGGVLTDAFADIQKADYTNYTDNNNGKLITSHHLHLSGTHHTSHLLDL